VLLDVIDQLLQRIATIDVETATALVGVGADNLVLGGADRIDGLGADFRTWRWPQPFGRSPRERRPLETFCFRLGKGL